jgi:hypothetical protein
VIFLGKLFGAAIFVPNPTSAQWTIFRIIIAVAASGVAAVIPGFLDVKMGAGRRFALRAGGALAVFAIVYFFDPAARLKSGAVNSTSGDASPIAMATLVEWKIMISS